MYAPPPTARNAAPARSGLLASGPLLAVCCLLFILFLIASTIVLALIPVYVSRTDVSMVTKSSTYSATLAADGLDNQGTLEDESKTTLSNAMADAIGVPKNALTVLSGQTSPARRRRRGFGLARERRASLFNLIILFFFNRALCSKCGNSGFLAGLKNFSFTCEIVILGFDGIRRRLTLRFIGFVSTNPMVAGTASTSTMSSSASTATAKLTG